MEQHSSAATRPNGDRSNSPCNTGLGLPEHLCDLLYAGRALLSLSLAQLGELWGPHAVSQPHEDLSNPHGQGRQTLLEG